MGGEGGAGGDVRGPLALWRVTSKREMSLKKLSSGELETILARCATCASGGLSYWVPVAARFVVGGSVAGEGHTAVVAQFEVCREEDGVSERAGGVGL